MKMNLNLLKKLMIIIALLAVTSTNAFSQGSTKGKTFWLGFLTNYTGSLNLYLFLSSDQDANVNISIPLAGYSQDYFVAANTTYKAQIPVSYAASLAETSENKGVVITSDVDINVFAGNYQNYTTDATIVLPIGFLGQSYMVADYGSSGFQSQMLVVPTEDNTSVTITPVTNTSTGKPAGVPFNVILNKGQIYQVRSAGSSVDLTGSSISADKKIAVFAGNQCSNIPIGYGYCDHLYEEMYPMTSWGNKFITVPLKTRVSDTYRVVAGMNATNIYVNGALVATKNAGQFYEWKSGNVMVIESNNPVMVVQYSNGSTWDNTASDPFMIVQTPTGMILNDISFDALSTGVINTHFLNITCPSSCTYEVYLDGVSQGANFSPVPNDLNYSFAQLSIPQGPHRLYATNLNNCGFSATVYGYGQDDSYGYNFGLSNAQFFSADVTMQLTSETNALTVANNFPVGSIFDVCIKITDPSAPFVNSTTLHYRHVENPETSWTDVPMTQNGDIWCAQIPANITNSPGVQFWASCTDGFLTYNLPQVNPQQNPFNIAIINNSLPDINLVGQYHLTPANVNNAMMVTVTASDNTNNLDSVNLFYRKNGQQLFQKTIMTTTGNPNEFHANIPSSFVTQTGLDFYGEARDNWGLKRQTQLQTLLYEGLTDTVKLIWPPKDTTLNLTSPFATGFSWHKATGAVTYELNISETPDFNLIAYNNPNLSDTTGITNLQNNKDYYWQVRSRSGLTVGPWSGSWKFTVGTTQAICGVVSLQTPPDGSNILNNDTLGLTWSATNSPVNYNVQISANSNFNTTVYDDTTHATTLKMYAGTLNPGQYYWHIRGNNGVQWCDWSSTRTFTVITPQDLHVSLRDTTICGGGNHQVRLGVPNPIQGGSGDFSIFWHPANQVDDSHSASPMATCNYTTHFTLTVVDNVTNQFAQAMMTVYVSDAPDVSMSPFIYWPKNTPLNLNNVSLSINGGTQPYSKAWYNKNHVLIPDPTNVNPTVGLNYYYLVVNDAVGCQSREYRMIVIVYPSKEMTEDNFAMSESGNSWFFLYPNPVINNLNLSGKIDSKGAVNLSVINATGQTVLNSSISSTSLETDLNLTDLAAGVYFIRLESNGEVLVKKFVKQ